MFHFLLLRMLTLRFYGTSIFLRTAIFQQEDLTVCIDKNAKTVWVIDVAVPADRRVRDKETEKTDKYQELCLENIAVMEHENNCNPNCGWCFRSGVCSF